MGSGCAIISNIESGVLVFVVIQRKASDYKGQWTFGQWTVRKPLRLNSNFSEEFESGNGVNVGTESNWQPQLAVSISPNGPEPSTSMSNRPTRSTAQPYACRDARGWDNLPASSLIRPNPAERPLRRIVRSVGPRASIAQGDEGLEVSRIPLECKLDNTQNESQSTIKSSLNSRKIQSSTHTNYRVRRPTTRVI